MQALHSPFPAKSAFRFAKPVMADTNDPIHHAITEHAYF